MHAAALVQPSMKSFRAALIGCMASQWLLISNIKNSWPMSTSRISVGITLLSVAFFGEEDTSGLQFHTEVRLT
jgi:hypothetical protein